MNFGYDATYHACPEREWFASFEKLDRGLVSIGDGHTSHIEGICINFIKLSDGIVRELQDVKYIP